MNSLIDSNVFIACWHKRDQYNEQAIRILQKIARCEIKNVIITNYVLLEVVNFLIKKVPFEVVKEAYDYLTKTERIKIVYVDKVMSYELEQALLQFRSLSLTDCSLVVLARELEIKPLYSFDGGFDAVKWVERKEN